MDLFNYSRRETSEVNIGAVPLGGSNPIRIQSMTNTSTQDTEASVEQAKRIVDAGGEYVRLTTQGIKEAENLMNINIGLRSQEYMVPLVADVHFNPKVADIAALYAEKVRINPGNYVDPGRTFKQLQRKQYRYPYRSQPRLTLRPHYVPLWRYSGRHGRIVHGVPAHLCCREFQRCRNIHKSVQYGNHGTDRPPAGCCHGKRRHVVPPSFGSN